MHAIDIASMLDPMGWRQVEIMEADDTLCVVVAEAHVDVQGGRMRCLTGRDLTDYDYISVG
jgi:hypothetical protein